MFNLRLTYLPKKTGDLENQRNAKITTHTHTCYSSASCSKRQTLRAQQLRRRTADDRVETGMTRPKCPRDAATERERGRWPRCDCHVLMSSLDLTFDPVLASSIAASPRTSSKRINQAEKRTNPAEERTNEPGPEAYLTLYIRKPCKP